MSKGKVIWSGIAAFIPFVLFIVLMVFMVDYFSSIAQIVRTNNQEIADAYVFEKSLVLIIWSIIVCIASLGGLIYFIYDVFHNKYVERDRQVAWLLVVLLASVVGFPVYWFINIYKHRTKNDTLTTELS